MSDDDDWGDGWGGDDELDDLIGDDEDLGGQPSAAGELNDTQGGDNNNHSATDSQNGWGDDDLGDLSGDDDAIINDEDNRNQYESHQNYGQEEQQYHDSQAELPEEGWGEDDDVLDHLSGSEGDSFHEASEYNSDRIHMTPPRPNNRGCVDQVHQELISYVEALMFLLPSVNAVLEAEYNQHPQKAHDLVHYYHERPQLCQYTIEKELDRMDYGVILDEDADMIIENKPEIAQLLQLQPDLHLLARCANQSLLADLLQVMTGPDRMVRPQYMATCLAQSCRFTIRAPGAGGTVECHSQMVLSLPEPSGTRYPVAQLQAHIVFAPLAPTIHYHVDSMDIVLPSMDLLRPTAEFLVESGLLDHPEMMSPMANNTAEADDFRDVFLQQSQTLLANSSVGLKSAWQQIDSVAGFQNKINLVKKILPSSEPGLLQAALDEQDEWHQQLQRDRQVQQQLQQQPPPPDTVPVSYPPPQQQAAPARPTSILGSFMGRLAQKVALPDEDPSIYASYAQQSQPPPQQHAASSDEGPHFPPPQGPPRFPRPDEVTPARQVPQPGHFPRPDEVAPLQSAQHFPRPEEVQPSHSNSGNFPRPDTTTAPVPAPVHFPRPEEVLKAGGPWSQLKQPSTVPPPVPPAAGITPSAKDHGDGWEDDDFDLDLGDNDVGVADNEQGKPLAVPKAGPSPNATVPPSAPVRMASPQPPKVEPKKPNEGYSPEDDIVETRKRWVNPRPGSRRLRAVLS